MLLDNNKSKYELKDNYVIIETNKNNITIVNEKLVIYNINDFDLKIPCSYKQTYKNILEIYCQGIISNNPNNLFAKIENYKIKLFEIEEQKNETVTELEELLEEYKESAKDLNKFVNNKLNGRNMNQNQNMAPKR